MKLKTSFKQSRKLQGVPDRFYFGFPVKPYSISVFLGKAGEGSKASPRRVTGFVFNFSSLLLHIDRFQ